MYKTAVAASVAAAANAWEQQTSYRPQGWGDRKPQGFGIQRPADFGLQRGGKGDGARGIDGIGGIRGFDIGSGFQAGAGDVQGFQFQKQGRVAQVQRDSYTRELDQIDNAAGDVGELRDQENSFELGYGVENEGNFEDVADDFENVGGLQKYDDSELIGAGAGRRYGGYGQQVGYGRVAFGGARAGAKAGARADAGARSFGGARAGAGARSFGAIGSAGRVGAKAASFGADVTSRGDARVGGRISGFGDRVGAKFGARSFGGRAARFGSGLGGRIGGRTADISDRLGAKNVGNISYGNSRSSYSGISIEKEEPEHYGYGHTHKHTIEWGPFSYRQPRVEYGVYGPKTDLRTRGARGHFGIEAASLKTRTDSGRLGFKRPNLANAFKRPEIENFAPKFAFRAPEVSFRGGEAKTRGPQNHYAGAQIEQTFEGPQTKLWAPRAEAKVWGPQGRFAVDGPEGRFKIAGPEDHYALHAPKKYISAHQHSYEVHIPEYHAPKISHEAKWTEYEEPAYEAPAKQEAPQYAW